MFWHSWCSILILQYNVSMMVQDLEASGRLGIWEHLIWKTMVCYEFSANMILLYWCILGWVICQSTTIGLEAKLTNDPLTDLDSYTRRDTPEERTAKSFHRSFLRDVLRLGTVFSQASFLRVGRAVVRKASPFKFEDLGKAALSSVSRENKLRVSFLIRSLARRGGILQIGKVPNGENHPDMNVPAMLEATKHGWFRGF